MKTNETKQWQELADEAIADAGEWKRQARLLKAQRDELAAALSQFMTWWDDGTLVRDITGDNQPGWSIKMIEFVRQLQLARAALAKAEGEQP